MNYLKLICKAGSKTTSDEFKVLFFICNTLSLNKTNEMKINRARIAELCGWWNEDKPKYSMNKISKITTSLVEKGLLKKNIYFDKTTSERTTFYSLPTLEDEKHLTKKVEKFENIPPKSRASNSINSIEKNEYGEYEEIVMNKDDSFELPDFLRD